MNLVECWNQATGQEWEVSKATPRSKANNIVSHPPGQKRAAKSVMKYQATFLLFFNGDMVDEIIQSNNIKIESQQQHHLW